MIISVQEAVCRSTKYLELDKLDCSVAIIKNAKSDAMGKKDIIKIEGMIDVDLDVLGFIDCNITINIIENGKIIEKKKLKLPKMVKRVRLFAKTHVVLPP